MPEKTPADISSLSAVQKELIDLWESVLKLQPIDLRDDFFELGGHSVLAVDLFSRIEKRFSKKLPLTTLLHAPTIEQLASLLVQQGKNTIWNALALIQPHGDRPPLFLVPGLGGNIVEFRLLSHYLGTEQPVYGLQSRGLDGRAQPIARIEAMAEYYIDEIRSVRPVGPYFIGGFSFGTLVALEMARQLQLQEQQVGLLVLLDPIFYFGQNRGRIQTLAYLHELVIKAIKLPLCWIYRRLGLALPPRLRTFNVFYTNKKAIQYYRIQRYPGKTLCFLAEQSRRAQLQLQNMQLFDEIEYRWIPGSHHDQVKEPAVKKIAECTDIALT